jgi:hypothetical protein
MWETHEEFSAMLADTWKSGSSCESAEELSQKLTHVSTSVAKWGRETFGSVRHQIRVLQRQLSDLRSVPERERPSHVELKLVEKLEEVLHREEVMWRQRSRIQWLAEGDKNTHFFHQRSSRRKKKNKISEIVKEDGSIVLEEAEMGGEDKLRRRSKIFS